MRRPSLPSPGTAIALVALVTASAGTATAATLITGKQIKDSSITGKDVKNRSLTARDFRGSVRGPTGATGPQGPAGAQGAQGAQGPQGAPGSDASVNGMAAGGDLTGTFPNPTIANGAVTPAKMGSAPAARATSNAAQSLNNQSTTTLVLANEVYDTANMYDATTGEITIPLAGVYVVSAGARWEAFLGGMRMVHVSAGGSQVASNGTLGDGDFFSNTSATTTVRLQAGDVVKAQAFHNSGEASLDVLDAPATHLAAAWIAP